jgi:hypothetical protein
MNIFHSVVSLSDDQSSLVSWSRYTGYAVLTVVKNLMYIYCLRVFGLCPSSGFFLNNNEKAHRVGWDEARILDIESNQYV